MSVVAGTSNVIVASTSTDGVSLSGGDDEGGQRECRDDASHAVLDTSRRPGGNRTCRDDRVVFGRRHDMLFV